MRVLFCVIVAAVVLSATAKKSDETTNGNCGNGIFWYLDSDSGSLTITGNGDLLHPCDLSDHSAVKSITIKSGITTIGKEFFKDWNSVETVTIPDTVSGMGSYAFAGCSKLKHLTIPGKYGSYYSDINQFEGCVSLSDLTIVGQKVDDNVFKGWKTLVTVVVSDSVSEVGSYAFAECENLASLTFGKSVETIGECAFQHCTSLTSITLPASLDSVDSTAFLDCHYLESIEVDDANLKYSSKDGILYSKKYDSLIMCPGGKQGDITIPGTVTSISPYSFYKCPHLTSVTFNSILQSIGEYAFYWCSGLTSLVLPDSLETIGTDSFNGCTGLKTVTVPGDVKSYIGTFTDSNDLETLIVSGYFVQGEMFNWIKARTVIIEDSVRIIKQSAFYGAKNMVDIQLGKNVEIIEKYAFSYSGLKTVTIPASVKSIEEGAFGDCYLESIDVDGNNSYYSSVDNVLLDKDETTLLLYPMGKAGGFIVPSSVKNVSKASFSNCVNLTSIELSSVEDIGERAFLGCNSLTSLALPSSLKTIEVEAFSKCKGLKSVTFKGDIDTVGSSAFSFCEELELVSYKGVNDPGTGSDDVFRGCGKMEYVCVTPDYSSESFCGYENVTVCSFSSSQSSQPSSSSHSTQPSSSSHSSQSASSSHGGSSILPRSSSSVHIPSMTLFAVILLLAYSF